MKVEQQKNKEKDIGFHGFSKPTYTQVPDEFFDLLLPELSEAELKVLLYIIRRTLGWKKDSDKISLNQLEQGNKHDKGCGLKRKAIIKGLQSLEEKKCITVLRQKTSGGINQINVYSLNFKKEGVVSLRHYGSVPKDIRGSVPNDTQQETGIKSTTTTVVVDFEKFKDYIPISLSETEIRQIALTCSTDIGNVYYAADVMDFQVRTGTKIEKNKKVYLISLVRAIRKGTLSIPEGYLPPWERAEKARQEAELQKKEKSNYDKIKNEIETERLSPVELENLKAKNAPALLSGAVGIR